MNQIKEIKERVGQEAESIISNGLGLVKVGTKYRCINNTAHKHGDKTPSMSWDRRTLMFHCFACGLTIDIYGYYKDYLNYSHNEIIKEFGGYSCMDTNIQEDKNIFFEEAKKVTPVTDECIKYINSRGINRDTINHFNICTYKGLIAFPYYKNNSVVGYKLRKPIKNPDKPKMTNIKGSKPLLFNMNNIDINNNELIICEGEFDCMIIYQCGFTNVVSVGAGANSLKSIFDQTKDFLNKFNSLIIISDNDSAGQSMDKQMIEYFGDKAKLIDKKLYTTKDINEEYHKHGKDKIIELIESARFKIEGRRDLEKEPYKGLDHLKGNYIPTGIKTVDDALNDLAPRCLTLITGRSNGGKTTFIKQIIANAIDKGNKVFVMNGENDPEMFLNELYQIPIGKDIENYDLVKVNKKIRKEPKPNILKKLQKWHKNKLYMWNKGDCKPKTIDGLINDLETEIKFNQDNLIIIDNLMSILSVKAAEKYEQQADFVQRLCDLAKLYNTHIILVLHPNKTYSKGSDMDFEQISGSSDIYNKADNIISVIREYDDDIRNERGIDGYIHVLKNRYYGELPKIDIHYDKETGLLLEIDSLNDVLLTYKFNWNNRDKIEGIQEVISDSPF